MNNQNSVIDVSALIMVLIGFDPCRRFVLWLGLETLVMRDYKNVRVPKAYRAGAKRASVKRVYVGLGSGRPGKNAPGIKSAMLQFLVIVVIAAAGWLSWQAYRVITHAEMFQVAGVDVKGVRNLGDIDLKNIVGAFSGQNIFRIDIAAAARRARANPWVKEVRIHRSLPNRISMVIVERAPYAVLDAGAGRYLMDNHAVIIKPLVKEERAQWPLPVVAIKDYRVRSGEPVLSDGVVEAFTLISEISAQGGWRLAEVTIKASSPESLSVEYAQHEFKIGNGNYALKLRRLAEIISDVKRRGLDIAYVDLRPERQAAVMAKK